MDKNQVVWKNYGATGRDLHVDVPMSQAIMNYRTQGLIGDFVFPIVPVTKQSNMIPFFPLGEFLRGGSLERAPGTQAAIVQFEVGTIGYYCKNYAAKFPLTIEDLNNADEIWNVRQNGAQLCVDAVRIEKEKRVFAAINATSGTNVSTVFVALTAWNGAGNPIQSIRAAQDQIEDTTGIRPNRVLFGQAAYRACMTNSAIRTFLYPHGAGIAPLTSIGGLVDAECQVARGYYNAGAEKQAVSLTKYFNDKVLVFFCPPADGTLGPSPRYGSTLRWTLPGIPNMAVEALPYDPAIKAEFSEVGVYEVEKVLDSKLGALIINTNAATTTGV
jgi:hypothetical protein